MSSSSRSSVNMPTNTPKTIQLPQIFARIIIGCTLDGNPGWQRGPIRQLKLHGIHHIASVLPACAVNSSAGVKTTTCRQELWCFRDIFSRWERIHDRCPVLTHALLLSAWFSCIECADLSATGIRWLVAQTSSTPLSRNSNSIEESVSSLHWWWIGYRSVTHQLLCAPSIHGLWHNFSFRGQIKSFHIFAVWFIISQIWSSETRRTEIAFINFSSD